MAGLITNGLPQNTGLTGAEMTNLDTQIAFGQAPQSTSISMIALAIALKWANTHSSRTMVSGTRLFTSVAVGAPTTFTGIDVLIGATGGTDNLIVELHDSTGAIVATSALAGTLAGTANLFQRIPFTAPYTAAPGTYYAVVQSNGTTANIAVLASAGISGITNGTATGTFGTSAAITPPTTYTAGVSPLVHLY